MILEFSNEAQSNGKIKVIGIGGAGCNAVDGMLDFGLSGVELMVMNTDVQSLLKSKTAYKVQLGETVTRGLGAGGDPELGKKAAEESLDLIRDALLGANIVFLAAGLGGGTGTGALPVIAKLAKELGILTVGVVTKPFKFEINRVKIAEQGITELKDTIDALMIIPNDYLISLVGETATLAETFATANNMLYQAVSSISDLIYVPGIINVDFASIKSVMGNQGGAVIGIGTATGENRATLAVKSASESGLLEKSKIAGAKNILLNITGGPSLTIGEIYQAAGTVATLANPQANIIFGAVIDEQFGDAIKVTMIATGFEGKDALSEIHQDFSETKAKSIPLEQIEEKVSESSESIVEPFTPVPILEPTVTTSKNDSDKPAELESSPYTDTPLFAPPESEKSGVHDSEIGIPQTPAFSPTDYEIPAYLRRRQASRPAV
ncbi:MAG: cell division protein FtsZ [bacterium]|nr:cell division protein FtsZ [bacterium]